MSSRRWTHSTAAAFERPQCSLRPQRPAGLLPGQTALPSGRHSATQTGSRCCRPEEPMISAIRPCWGSKRQPPLGAAPGSSPLRAVPGQIRHRHPATARAPCVTCMSGRGGDPISTGDRQSKQRSSALEETSGPSASAQGGEDGGEQVLQSVSRSQVISACVKTSVGMLVVAFPLQELARIGSASLFGTSQEAVDELLNISFNPQHIGPALAAAAAVTCMRLALLKTWPDFADSTERSNTQVLTPLEPLDIVVVASLPAIAEEALFRGTLVPATFPDWRGALIAGIIFGVLHNSGGRNWAFSAWASAVGVFYGGLYLYTKDISSAMIAHAVANMASAAIWVSTRDEGNPATSSGDGNDINER